MPHAWSSQATLDDEESRAAGTYTAQCPVCGEHAIPVSTDTVPRVGPVAIDGYDAHESDGAAYYHDTES